MWSDNVKMPSLFHRDPMMVLRLIKAAVYIVLLGGFVSCSNPGSDQDTNRYYAFTHQGDQADYGFVAKTSDREVISRIEEELDKPLEERKLHINGDIARGQKHYNSRWSWHFVPGEWNLVEVSAEVCDGRPRMVENDLDYWVGQVGYFCPWSSRVLREVNP